jgi:hypothetical protein
MISFKEILKEKKEKVTEWKIQYLNIRPEQKVTLRIIPMSLKVNESPFIERLVYYTSSGSIDSPKNYGEIDPVIEFLEKLKLDPNNWRVCKKNDPNLVTQVPVIVREYNNEQMYIWNLGKSTYNNLLEKLSEYEDSNPLCPLNGYDLEVTKDLNYYTHIRVIPNSSQLIPNKQKIVDLVLQSSQFKNNFRRIESDLWIEIYNDLRSQYLEGKMNEFSVSNIITDVTSSINF